MVDAMVGAMVDALVDVMVGAMVDEMVEVMADAMVDTVVCAMVDSLIDTKNVLAKTKVQQYPHLRTSSLTKTTVLIVRCLRFTKLCWVGKHVNIIMKPTNSPSQGQPNPTKNR